MKNRMSYWLAVFMLLAGPSRADVFVPQPTLRQLGGRPVWVPICSRRGVNGSAAFYDNTNTAAMDQVGCYSPAWGTVSAVKLVYAAFDMSQAGEVDRPVTASITASIFNPTANNVSAGASVAASSGATSLTFSGTALGVNSISVGQTIYSATGLAGNTYVTGVSTAYTAGSGNNVGNTTVTLSAATTAAISVNQVFSFNGAFAQAKWAGGRNTVIAAGHDVVTSDAMSAQMSPGTLFFVRTAATFSGTGMQLMDYPGTGSRMIATYPFQEFDVRGTTPNDQTMNPSLLNNTGGGYWCPVMVLGLVTPTAGTAAPGGVLVLGDSIAAGTGDIADSLYLQGYIQRSLENQVPFVTAARGSTLATGMLGTGNGQYALSIDTGITDILLELGRNDIQQFGVTAAALEGVIANVASRFLVAGKRVWCFTVPPTTISADGWTTLGNQSWIQTAYTSSGSVSAGATAIVLSGISNISTGQTVVMPPSSQVVSAAVAPGGTAVTLYSVSGLYVGQAVYGPGVATGTTIGAINNLTVTMAKAASGAIPANAGLTFGTGIAPGTSVVSINAGTKTITLSTPTIAAIASGATVYTGSQLANAAESQRGTYNSYLRSSVGLSALGCTGLVDDDAVMADPGGSGKWRVDLGAASVDGVHPAAALHQAAVAAGIIKPAMFPGR